MKKMSRITYLVLVMIISISTVTPVSAAEYGLGAEDVKTAVSGNDLEIIVPEEDPEHYNEAQVYHESSISSLGIDVSASSYDPRTINKVSDIRWQTGGTCWLYAAVAACESNLIHKGYEDSSVDLSELQLLYFAKNGFTDKLGNYTRSNYWDDLTMKEYIYKGEGPITVENLLAQWCGPVSEQRASIPSGTLTERVDYACSVTLDSAMAWEAEYHLCGSRSLRGDTQNPTSIIPYVKELIADYGGVTADFYYYTVYNNRLPGGDQTQYCYDDRKDTNHSIEIIGWDDEFSASNFIRQPSGDGAWLCKDSNGIHSNASGYIWISYYDRTLCSFLAFDLEKADNYENIYGYRDDVANGLYYKEKVDDTIIYHSMSVFEASAYEEGASEQVDAVMVDALYADKEYNITLYANPVVEDGRLVSYTGKTDTKILHTDYAGMYKIDFSEAPLYIVDGNTFGIYVETNGNINSATHQMCKAYTNRADEFVKAESIRFAEEEVILTENDVKRILPTVLPETATRKECYFSSSDETVAVVDQDGTVRPVGFGECDITAISYDGSSSDSYRVLVKCTELSLADNQVYTGETMQMLPGTLNDIQGIMEDRVSWAVSDTSVAEIDGKGVLSGKKAGEVTVSVRLKENAAVTATCTVKVLQRATSIKVNNVNDSNVMYLFVGDTEQLSTTLTPADVTDRSLRYTLLDENNVVSLDKKGVITALERGRAEIEVKTLDGSGLSEVITVEVLPKVTNINIYVNDGEGVRQNQKAYVTIDFWQDASLFQDKISVSFSNPKAVQVENIICCNNYQFEMNIKEAGKHKMTVTLDDKDKTSKTITINVKSDGSGNSTGNNTGSTSGKVKSFTVNSMNYKVSGDTVSLTGTSSMAANITIPSKVTYQGKSYKVTYIEAKAFKGNTKIKKVIIPGTVTMIGTSAFEGCSSLATIKIPGTVKSICYNAFKNCSKLKTVTLNEGLANIEKNAFLNCKALTKITIPASVKKIGMNAFQDCTKLKTVSFKSGSVLKTLGNNVFANCKALTKVTLPAKLIVVPNKAFYKCNKLKTVTIGKNVTSIGSSAFSGTAITKIVIPSNVRTIGKQAFYNCSKLKTVTFKGTKVYSVGKQAFSKMNKNGSIKVPERKMKSYTKLLKGKYTKGVKIK